MITKISELKNEMFDMKYTDMKHTHGSDKQMELDPYVKELFDVVNYMKGMECSKEQAIQYLKDFCNPENTPDVLNTEFIANNLVKLSDLIMNAPENDFLVDNTEIDNIDNTENDTNNDLPFESKKNKIKIKMFEEFQSDKLIATSRIVEILNDINNGSLDYKISNTNNYKHEDFENNVTYNITVEIYNDDEILSFVITVVESKLADETTETKYEETYNIHYTNDSKDIDIEFPDGQVELEDDFKKFFEFKYDTLIQQ